MTFDYVKSAMLNGRNILVFIASLILLSIASEQVASWYPTLYFLEELPLAGSLLAYAAFTAQTVFDKKFREAYDEKKLTRDMNKNLEAAHTSARLMRRHLDSIYDQRMGALIRDVDEAVASYTTGEKTAIKFKIAQKSVSLAQAYLKLLENYCRRARSSHGEQISFLARRINTNTNNLKNVRDDITGDEIRRVIETDEKMIATLKGERADLDKIDARLQYMESTVSMLKYNAVANLESDELLRSLEEDIEEASAINAVLNERKEESRGRGRIRL